MSGVREPPQTEEEEVRLLWLLKCVGCVFGRHDWYDWAVYGTVDEDGESTHYRLQMCGRCWTKRTKEFTMKRGK